MSTLDDALGLAALHALPLSPNGATVVEAGLDYRVIMATDETGHRWVLRVPRRPDVSEGMAAEIRILDFVAPTLRSEKVAVPDWQIRTPELIAYPALPGAPGLTLSDAGEPIWHMDPASQDYAVRLGRLLARLHSLDAMEARTAGIEVRSPEQVRQTWQDDINRVSREFTVAPALSEAWHSWVGDDICWPDRTVMTHGEIYPAHVLLDQDGAITGVLDWTTARVDDPARDFAFQYGAAGDEILQVTLDAYEQAGGHLHPGLAAQSRHLWEASPLGYAIYAQTTGAEADRAAAAAMLNPEA
ncbi:MAG: aminoglycoside phosphotransferase [Kocuria rhizophila]|uniref:macrolide 2'-phosphotransferase n=1 Tax=Kocuria carniphila TaxID=262208 RepID=UPI000DAFD32C|nr:macrolide 2'-phosphotransferase [Kocuria carniphila]MCT1801342.1 macrolide 2'-phosphotransferase [Kocuria carniphila]PZP27995.1 MAG: aminoglycoside phosphotransferase [Kocuria rhizophila]